jgi:Tol biopolymer transport system component
MMLTLDKDRRVRPLVRGSVPTAGAESSVSLDGRWLAYVGINSRTPQVFVIDLLHADGERVHIAGGSQPRWAPNGRELFYTGLEAAHMSVPVLPGATLATGEPSRLFAGTYFNGLTVLSRGGTYDVAPDGRRFLMLKQGDSAEQPVEPPTVIVVKNWMEELKRLVPSGR